ncbi:MAG TPA: phosphotransferase [Actinotalea sp.]|nr:phosphotransferase [Actinotalea sp.]
MPRSPLALAALATVAIPGLDAFDVRRSAHPGPGIDAAVVIDAEGGRWVVRAPQDSTAGAGLEAEVALLEGLVHHVDAGHLPFDVPRPAGFVPLPEGGRVVVHRQLGGRPLRLERLGPGPGLAAELGRAIAALHELPVSVIEDAGLPVYEAEAYRQRRLAEVDEAARTGLVPTVLLRRWERALEDVALWRFRPTVVHGDLSAEHVLCTATEPVAVLGWSEAKVADPADDLAWLLVAAPEEAVDPILEAYHLRRTEMRDHHLASRALLAGELAVARWLLHGVRIADAAIVEDATGMLRELEEHLLEATAEAPDEPVEAVPDDEGWPDDGWSELETVVEVEVMVDEVEIAEVEVEAVSAVELDAGAAPMDEDVAETASSGTPDVAGTAAGEAVADGETGADPPGPGADDDTEVLARVEVDAGHPDAASDDVAEGHPAKAPGEALVDDEPVDDGPGTTPDGARGSTR